MKKIKPIIKQLIRWAKFCPQCDEPLRGNGSLALPYACDCGEWEYDSKESGDYYLETNEHENQK